MREAAKPPRRIVGVLLAAGKGTRFGGDKLLAPLPRPAHISRPGSPLGVAAATHLVAALPDAIAVIRPHDAPLADALRCAVPRIVRCARADDGLGASLACAVAATADADGWVVALADMPWIAPATISAVAAAVAGGADIAAPSWRGTRGHPVGFSGRHREALLGLCGDAGARAILERHPQQVVLIEVADPGVLADVDTPGDLQSLPNGGAPRVV